MKTHKNYLLFLFLICFIYSCEDPVIDKTVDTKTIKMKYNIIGISGDASSTPYVEIQYVKDEGNGHNVIESKMVSPPFVFGGHGVNIRYDSIVSYMGNKAVAYSCDLLHDYNAGGAEYLRIINHSEVYSIEYFIAGAQDMDTYNDGCNGLQAITNFPAVYYQKAPIYYLLFPSEKYDKNLVPHSYACNDIYYFEGNKCGDLELATAWDIDDIAKLYRAEFNNSKDTVLHLDPKRYTSYGRLSKALKTDAPYIKDKSLYGIIPPKGKLEGKENIWLIATPSMFDWTIKHGSL